MKIEMKIVTRRPWVRKLPPAIKRWLPGHWFNEYQDIAFYVDDVRTSRLNYTIVALCMLGEHVFSLGYQVDSLGRRIEESPHRSVAELGRDGLWGGWGR